MSAPAPPPPAIVSRLRAHYALGIDPHRRTSADWDALEAADLIERLLGENRRLTAWKSEAIHVLNGWNDLASEVFALMGKPVELLGRPGVDVVRAAFKARS